MYYLKFLLHDNITIFLIEEITYTNKDSVV